MSISNVITRIKVKKWIKDGLSVGENVKIESGVSIDPSFPWLVTIGNDVTIAPDCLILCHDGSMKTFVGNSRIGRVTIGDKVFIGAKSIILPNVTIGFVFVYVQALYLICKAKKLYSVYCRLIIPVASLHYSNSYNYFY